VTLPEKIKQLKAAIDAVNEPCEVCGNTADEYGRIEHGRGCYVVEEDGGGYSHVPLEDLGTAARETCPPLIAAYTAILTALESSDSDRQKLAARVAELEALCQTIGKQSTEYATKVGYAEGRAMGLEYRVKQLEAELAKEQRDG
jgi:hypothetical protein